MRGPLPVDLDPKDFPAAKRHRPKLEQGYGPPEPRPYFHPAAKRHRQARWGVLWLIVAGLLIWSGRCAVAAALMSGG